MELTATYAASMGYYDPEAKRMISPGGHIVAEIKLYDMPANLDQDEIQGWLRKQLATICAHIYAMVGWEDACRDQLARLNERYRNAVLSTIEDAGGCIEEVEEGEEEDGKDILRPIRENWFA